MGDFRSLPTFPNLLMPIKLQSNKIGVKGAEMIAEALITNNVLTTLDLAVRFGI